MKIVIYGLAITSLWGNGHATTYRSLCKALARRGHQIHFVEKNVEWFRNNRDMPHPEFWKVHLYTDWAESERSLIRLSKDADAIVVESYFPDAIAATESLLQTDHTPLFFYDIDTPITVASSSRSTPAHSAPSVAARFSRSWATKPHSGVTSHRPNPI